MIGPVFEELSGDPGKLTFIKVDVDAAEDISQKCGISAMPTFQVWQGGKKVDARWCIQGEIGGTGCQAQVKRKACLK